MATGTAHRASAPPISTATLLRGQKIRPMAVTSNATAPLSRDDPDMVGAPWLVSDRSMIDRAG